MIDWDIIIETIQEKKCVLFIGPEIFFPENGGSLNEELIQFLDLPNNSDIRKYYEEVGLFLFPDGKAKTKTYYRIKKFFNQSFPDAEGLFEKIAQIPFHLVISINPDRKLPRAFEQLGRQFKYDFYWKNKTGDQNERKLQGKSLPVLYNVLGDVDEQESMILSYDDLFDYFTSLANDVIPMGIRLNVKDATNLIFLGFEFEKWYMQLLLRFLYSKQDQYTFMQYASNTSIREQTKIFCVDQFQIEFVPSGIGTFVNTLYDKCKEAGILKGAEEDLFEQIETLLERDKVLDAMETLRTFLAGVGELGAPLMQRLRLLIGEYGNLKKEERLALLERKDIPERLKSIKSEFLEVVNAARELE